MKKLLIAFILLVSPQSFAQSAAGQWQKLAENYRYKEAIQILNAHIDSLAAAKDSVAIYPLLMQKVQFQKRIYDFNGALNTLNLLATGGGNNVAITAEFAECHRLMGNTNEALIFYGILKMLAPDNLYHNIQRGMLQYSAEDYQGSILSGREILQKDTINSVLTMVGNSFNKLNQLDSALHYYGIAYGKNQNDYKTLEKISRILITQKQYDSVVKLSLNYLERDSSNVPVNSIYGVALHLMNKYKESFEVFNKILPVSDDSVTVLHYMGLNMHKMEQLYKANDYLGRAYNADSTDVALLFNYAEVKTGIGHTKTAKKLYDKIEVLVSPDSLTLHQIYYGKAECYYREENFKMAAANFEKALQYDSKYTPMIAQLGYCYRRIENYKKAKEYYNLYLKAVEGKKKSATTNFVEEELEFIKEKEFML